MTAALLLALALGQYPQGYITVRDEGVVKGKAIEVNCTGTGVTCTQSGWQWTLSVGGGGSGSTTQFHGAAGPDMPLFSSGGVDWSVAPFTNTRNAYWGCAQPFSWSDVTIVTTGAAKAPTVVGTPTAVGYADVNDVQRARWVSHLSGVGVNAVSSIRSGGGNFVRGSGSTRGGFYWWAAFEIVSNGATQKVFAGISSSVLNLGSATPDALGHSVYFGCESAEANLSICSNNASGTAVCSALGASFPCKTAGRAYDVAIWAAPSASSVSYYIRRMDTGTEVSGTISSSELPANTLPLGWQIWMSTGSTSDQAQVYFGGSCFIGRP